MGVRDLPPTGGDLARILLAILSVRRCRCGGGPWPFVPRTPARAMACQRRNIFSGTPPSREYSIPV